MVVLLQELVLALGCFVGNDLPDDTELGSSLLLCERAESIDLGFFLLDPKERMGRIDKFLRL